MDYNKFVSDTYSTLLGRKARADEVSYWAGQMQSGAMTDAQVVANMKASDEYKNLNTSKNPAQPVPGTANPNDPSQISVVDYAGQVATNPSLHMGNDMQLGKNTPTMTGTEAGTNLSNPTPMNYSGTNATASQGSAATASGVDPRKAQTYDPALSYDKINQNINMQGAQGTVSQGAQVEAPQIDVEATANGQNALGQALLEHAYLDPNDVDPKATVKGQLEQLQADFTGPDGEPIIPNWAQGAARAVSKIAAFKGMTGTAATAAMSQAIMEASLPVATADAQFFQTLTLQNLTNEQQSIINRANILSKFEEINQDAKLTAAIQNAKSFLEMDLANLSNRQQAEVINTQARIQSILEDAKAENTQRLFTAQSKNDMNMFYDQLNASIKQFNATQQNAMTQFNVSERNAMAQFNSQLENNREQFYKTMQYNVDLANAQWRQSVTMQNNQNKFEAAALDVRNMVDLSREQLNQIWDRSDALLDYVWKSSESELQRDHEIALQTLKAQAEKSASKSAGIGSVLGTVAGAFSQNLFKSWFDKG